MTSRKTSHQRSSRAVAAASALAHHMDELLDAALAETFPASDPVSIHVSRQDFAGQARASRH